MTCELYFGFEGDSTGERALPCGRFATAECAECGTPICRYHQSECDACGELLCPFCRDEHDTHNHLPEPCAAQEARA